jgi:hypothetical protein
MIDAAKNYLIESSAVRLPYFRGTTWPIFERDDLRLFWKASMRS